MSRDLTILVTGVTGYIGGRLVPRLLEEGYRVRVLVRNRAERLAGRPWSDQVEMVVGDALQGDVLDQALNGVDSAFYLIHQMRRRNPFQERDVEAARAFGRAAAAASVGRIIYLSGLGDPYLKPAPNLRSRYEAGGALRQGGVPVTEFRAGPIIGSGSFSFEMIRHLTERLPIMLCPRWVFNRCQPIGVADVLAYLQAALRTPGSRGKTIEIGGTSVQTYANLLRGYAAIRGLRRIIIPLPVYTRRLSSYWSHLTTPVPADIAANLIDAMSQDIVVRDNLAADLFPRIKPLDYATAVKRALARIESGRVETIWSDALASSLGDLPPKYLTHEQGLFIERRRLAVNARPPAVFKVFSGLGGRRGWPVNWAWRLRGWADRLVGGVGLRRGRRDPDELRVGDVLDFWRVEAVEPNHLVRLRAEMRVPGLAWLQFETRAQDDGDSNLLQTAFFAPKGVTGLLYWYALYPIHATIFSRMAHDIGRAAEAIVE